MLLPPANEVWGKVIFYTRLSLCSQRGGACLSARWDTTPTLLGPCTPPPPGPCTPSPAQSMLGDTVNARAIRILLECNFVMMAPPLDSTSPYNPPPLHSTPFNPLHSNPPPPLRTLNVFSHSAKAKTKVEKEFLG